MAFIRRPVSHAPTLVDIYDPASFGGKNFSVIHFPVKSYSRVGGLRNRAHEYWKQPGAKQEKGGRRAYSYRITPVFNTTFEDQFPDLWPDNLRTLIRKFEAGISDILTLPFYGPVSAFCSNWQQSFDSMLLNGEMVELEFHEDDETKFTVAANELSVVGSISAVAKHQDTLHLIISSNDVTGGGSILGITPKERSLFDKLNDAMNVLRAAIDAVLALDRLVAANIENVVGLCDEISRIPMMLNPKNSAAILALRDVWAGAITLGQNILGQTRKLSTYVVPRTMTAQEVASAIYKDATRTVDILRVNDFENVNSIKAGTHVAYYPDA